MKTVIINKTQKKTNNSFRENKSLSKKGKVIMCNAEFSCEEHLHTHNNDDLKCRSNQNHNTSKKGGWERRGSGCKQKGEGVKKI